METGQGCWRISPVPVPSSFPAILLSCAWYVVLHYMLVSAKSQCTEIHLEWSILDAFQPREVGTAFGQSKVFAVKSCVAFAIWHYATW